MTRIRVATTIDAPPARVWEQLADVAGHVEWMRDAVAIRFRGEQTEGVGTTFDCDTRVGPLRLTDRMVVTEWVPVRSMAVRHVGLVEGTGRFRLTEATRDRTVLVWQEDLTFPWWMGGRIGGLVGGRVLAWIWRRNLADLRGRVEGR